MTIEQKVTALLRKGTSIVSFDYDGKTRNVVIGADVAATDNPRWGKHKNRAIVTHKGKKYLAARVNNDADATVKVFNIAKISRFQAEGKVIA